jgi:hypothetical protein
MLSNATFINIYVNNPEQLSFSIFRVVEEDYSEDENNKFLRNIFTLKAM